MSSQNGNLKYHNVEFFFDKAIFDKKDIFIPKLTLSLFLLHHI